MKYYIISVTAMTVDAGKENALKDAVDLRLVFGVGQNRGEVKIKLSKKSNYTIYSRFCRLKCIIIVLSNRISLISIKNSEF